MRVLIAHNSYQRPGGEDVVASQETDLLRRMGDQVIEYRRSNDDLRDLSSLAMLKTTLWSSDTYRELDKLIWQQKPEIAHFHNTFPLISPAAYYACRKNDLPVVQTLHNFRLFCPRADLYRNEAICELCLGKTPWPGIRHRCYRNSRLQTTAVAAMLAFHRWLRTWQEQVDLFVAPSNFVREKVLQGGISPEKVVVKPHFVDHDPGERGGKGLCADYALFAGRLSREKGLFTMLHGWSRLKGMKLKVVGAGADDPEVRDFLRGRDMADIQILGQCSRDKVMELMKGAFLIMFPSVLYETFGLSLIEAFACGVPVIASRLGAMSEIVSDGYNGLLFEPGNAIDLADKLQWAFHHRDEMGQMGMNARKAYKEFYTADANYSLLASIYKRAAVVNRASRAINKEALVVDF